MEDLKKNVSRQPIKITFTIDTLKGIPLKKNTAINLSKNLWKCSVFQYLYFFVAQRFVQIGSDAKQKHWKDGSSKKDAGRQTDRCLARTKMQVAP